MLLKIEMRVHGKKFLLVQHCSLLSGHTAIPEKRTQSTNVSKVAD